VKRKIKYFRLEQKYNFIDSYGEVSNWVGIFKVDACQQNKLLDLTMELRDSHLSPEADSKNLYDESWMCGLFYFTTDFLKYNFSFDLERLIQHDAVRVLLVFEDSKDYTVYWEGKSGLQVTLENLEEQDYEFNKLLLLNRKTK
jgi:hypothetical protein